MSEIERNRKQKEGALEELRAGNDVHEDGDFNAAIKHHPEVVMKLNNDDIKYKIDRSESYFGMEKYNECIAECIKVEERAQKEYVDPELRSVALSLKASAYVNLVKCAKDYDLAIKALDMAYEVHEDERTLHTLDKVRKAKKEFDIKERLGDLERESGNKLHMTNRIEAVKHYTEAIKLNPFDVKAYSNRALCYTLDGMLAEGLKDAEKCLELDPTFVKGYRRKGNIEFEKKEYSKALETYEMGLKLDKENKGLLDAIKKCHEQMPPEADNTITVSSDELKTKEANAMLDPEIQTILSDPIMRQVLINFRQNSSDAQEHAKNEMVLEKLQKLLDAGLL